MKTEKVIFTILYIFIILFGIFAIIVDDTWLGVFCIVFGVGLIVLFEIADDKENKWKDKEQQNKIKKIFGSITQSFCDGTMMDETTLRRLYEVNNLDESFESFADFLNNYLNILLNEKDDRIRYGEGVGTPNQKKSYDDINKYLSPIIQKEREEKPFEGVEEWARKLLQDIDKASKDHNSDAVSSSLKHLSNIMIENQKINSKENLKNSRFAKICGIATILSLMFAIIVFFIQNHRSLTGEDVKQNMIEVIGSCVVKDSISHVKYSLEFNNDSQTSSDQ